MIYRAIQLIQIFLADERTDGRTDGLTKVIQEVLADLNNDVADFSLLNEYLSLLTDRQPQTSVLDVLIDVECIHVPRHPCRKSNANNCFVSARREVGRVRMERPGKYFPFRLMIVHTTNIFNTPNKGQ